MQACEGVGSSFQDPSTLLWHHCADYLCYPADPENSPLDCRRKCPEYYECLLREHGHQLPTPDTSTSGENVSQLIVNTPLLNTSPALHSYIDVYIVILIVVLAVTVAAACFLFIFIWKKRSRSRNSSGDGPVNREQTDLLPGSTEQETSFTSAPSRQLSKPDDSVSAQVSVSFQPIDTGRTRESYQPSIGAPGQPTTGRPPDIIKSDKSLGPIQEPSQHSSDASSHISPLLGPTDMEPVPKVSGLYVDPASRGSGLYVDPASRGSGLYVDPASRGSGLYVDPASRGSGLYVDPASRGSGLSSHTQPKVIYPSDRGVQFGYKGDSLRGPFMQVRTPDSASNLAYYSTPQGRPDSSWYQQRDHPHTDMPRTERQAVGGLSLHPSSHSNVHTQTEEPYASLGSAEAAVQTDEPEAPDESPLSHPTECTEASQEDEPIHSSSQQEHPLLHKEESERSVNHQEPSLHAQSGANLDLVSRRPTAPQTQDSLDSTDSRTSGTRGPAVVEPHQQQGLSQQPLLHASRDPQLVLGSNESSHQPSVGYITNSLPRESSQIPEDNTSPEPMVTAHLDSLEAVLMTPDLYNISPHPGFSLLDQLDPDSTRSSYHDLDPDLVPEGPFLSGSGDAGEPAGEDQGHSDDDDAALHLLSTETLPDSLD